MGTTLVILLVIALFVLLSSFFTVRQQTAVIIERFGKFQSIRLKNKQNLLNSTLIMYNHWAEPIIFRINVFFYTLKYSSKPYSVLISLHLLNINNVLNRSSNIKLIKVLSKPFSFNLSIIK